MPVKWPDMTQEDADANFVKAQENDAMKNKFCADNGHRMVRIKYTDIHKVPEIIKALLESVRSI